MFQRGRTRGFTVVELLVVISIISFMLALFLPSLAKARRSSERLENANNLRSLHTAMVLFGEDNNSYYPGMDSNGEITEYETGARYKLLFDRNYTSPKVAISPLETANKTVWTGGTVGDNYSYAMSSIRKIELSFKIFKFKFSATYNSTARIDEWRAVSGSEVPIMSDRAIKNWEFFNAYYIKSIHTNPIENTYDWQGHVVWNDNHVTWEEDSSVDTRHGAISKSNDDLFKNSVENYYRVGVTGLILKLGNGNKMDDAYMSANTSVGVSTE